MLQCGGGNNSSSALLKQYFASEKACQLNALGNSGRYRSSGGGILPCPTPLTDLNSLKKAAQSHNKHPPLSPRSQGPQVSPRTTIPKAPQALKPLDGSLNSTTSVGAGGSMAASPSAQKAQSPRSENSPRSLSHGRTGPFGRRNVEKEFYDTVSTGHIPCLSYPSM